MTSAERSVVFLGFSIRAVDSRTGTSGMNDNEAARIFNAGTFDGRADHGMHRAYRSRPGIPSSEGSQHDD
jgi:hypothetical protein